MNKDTFAMLARLTSLGISQDDAYSLRRISMTLHRWHELECGDGNDHGSWCITRGRKVNGTFEHDDNGTPFIERHYHRKMDPTPFYSAIPDREKGAHKRLAAIMERYPALVFYVQGDPRGASLYILRRNDIPHPIYENIDAHYSRGVAVFK